MNLKEATTLFRIPANMLSRMEKEGLIGFPLDEASIQALSVLSQLWGRPWFIGESLKGIKVREKTMLLLFPDYNKVDRYVINTFLNAPDIASVSLDLLRYRVKVAFAADVDLHRLRDLRKTASDIKRKKRKLVLGKLSLNYADILGV